MSSGRIFVAAAAAVLLLGAAPSPYPGHPVTSPDITGADVLARDKAISDDAFEGRGPGTKNGEAAAQWLADELKRIGIKPGNHGSYFQKVPTESSSRSTPPNRTFAFDTPQGRADAEIRRRCHLLDAALRRAAR